jgi:hypothetical protein
MLSPDLPITLPYENIVDYSALTDDILGFDMDQTAKDLAVFSIPFRCEVIEAGLVVTETNAGGTTTPVVDFDKRILPGSDAGRVDEAIAHFVLSTTAAGKVLYDKAAIGTILDPGAEVVVQLTTAATGGSKAGHVRPYLLVKYRPETIANLANKVETA